MKSLPQVTSNPGGVSTDKRTATLGDYGLPNITKFHTVFDDFNEFLATLWTQTLVGTGTGTVAAGDNGILTVTTSAAANDANYYQKPTAGFLLEFGKRTFYKIKLNVADVVNDNMLFGFVPTTATPLAPAQGIYFNKASGAATLAVYVKSGTATTSQLNVGTLVAATDFTLGVVWDGKGEVTFFLNDQKVWSLDVGIVPSDILTGGPTTQYLPTVVLNPTFAFQSTTASAKTFLVDYVFASKER